ncbi:trypsin-like peptidase domain-containing protein [Mesorhizobium sp. WSM3859]|uniref:trypsin-like serine peptidase n=1 Tax=Mesorhizobium sp. WSM3859 TaxID=2029402 RepID=UPI000BB0BF5F|nr:trypsin-like peptidase domain-containing protein [Mesorhizobium sp. WSM3859]PBC08179.1 hypothetical protein CK230_21950 [Mesorhizobium sp. WSM3859]
MSSRGSGPRHPESLDAKAARLEERLKQIAPGGLLTKPNGESMTIEAAGSSLIRRASPFDGPSNTLSATSLEQIVASGIEAIRHVAEGGGRLGDDSTDGLLNLEAVINAVERVSWYVEDDDYLVNIRPIDDGLDGLWRDRFEGERVRVKKVCSSVAAIMIDGAPIGTGWLAATNTLVTNAHVAFNLCYRKPGLSPSDPRDRWRMASGRCFTAAFRFEHGNIGDANKHISVPIEDVLHVETSQHPDLAVFQIAPSTEFAMPEPLKLELVPPTQGDRSGKIVYTVGHPIADLQDDAANVALSFGALDGTKRFSPGKLIGQLDADVLAHDCSTTNGSSGSPLVAMGSTVPIGLHYFGRPGMQNEAVLLSAWAAHPAIKAIQSGQWD